MSTKMCNEKLKFRSAHTNMAWYFFGFLALCLSHPNLISYFFYISGPLLLFECFILSSTDA